MKQILIVLCMFVYSSSNACIEPKKLSSKFAENETVITEYIQGVKAAAKKRIERNISAMVDSILAQSRAGFSDKRCGSLTPGRMNILIENELGDYRNRADSILRRTLQWADSLARIFLVPELRLRNDTNLR